MTKTVQRHPKARIRAPRTTCNQIPISRGTAIGISPQLLILHLVQLAMIVTLVLGCGMAPLAAAALVVTVLASNYCVASASRACANLIRLAQSSGIG